MALAQEGRDNEPAWILEGTKVPAKVRMHVIVEVGACPRAILS